MFRFEPIYQNLAPYEREISKLEKIRYIRNPNTFHKETAYLKKVDANLSYYYLFSKIKSRPYNKGSGYLTHGFDFYKGNFHGQMIRGLINYSNLDRNSLILDPFCGSGTTLIEAKLLGFNSIGIDINPTACLNTRIKTESLDTPIGHLLSDNQDFFNLSIYPKIIKKQNYIDTLNDDFKKLFYVFLFTRAISDEIYIGKNREIAFKDNLRKYIYVLEQFEKLKNKLCIKLGNSKVYFNDSLDQLTRFKTNSVDLILTSPPYLDLINYIRNDYHQNQCLLNEDQIKWAEENSVGIKTDRIETTEALYWNKMYQILKLLYKVLKIDHYFILIIGNYRDLKEKYILLLKKISFYIENIIKRDVININNRNSVEYIFFIKKS